MAKGILIYEDFLALPVEKKIAFLEASQEAAVILSHVAENYAVNLTKLYISLGLL